MTVEDEYPHYVTISWGSEAYREPEDEPKTYYFHTEDELAAFMTGVEEACGYLDHDVEEDSRQTQGAVDDAQREMFGDDADFGIEWGASNG